MSTDDGRVTAVRDGRDVIVLDGLREVDPDPILRAFQKIVRVQGRPYR